MSEKLGATLPASLAALLDGTRLTEKIGQAFVLNSLDAAGWPHVALFSFGELLAAGPSTLRLGTWKGTTTSKNLKRDSRCTLTFVEGGAAYYVKCQARLLDEGVDPLPFLARFELTIDQILRDHEDDAPIDTPIRYGGPKTSDAMLAEWRSVLDFLRDA